MAAELTEWTRFALSGNGFLLVVAGPFFSMGLDCVPANTPQQQGTLNPKPKTLNSDEIFIGIPASVWL